MTNNVITLQQLTDADACNTYRDRFQEHFGQQVTLTAELVIQHANDYDWNWAARYLLDSHTQDEYNEKLATINREYDEKLAPINREYNEKLAPIDREYDEKLAAIGREYNEKLATINREYNEKLAPIDREYDEKLAPIDREYNEKLALLFFQLYTQ